MHCTNCGSKLAWADTVFCTQCGTKQGAGQSATHTVLTDASTNAPGKGLLVASGWGYIIVGAGFALMGLAGLISGDVVWMLRHTDIILPGNTRLVSLVIAAFGVWWVFDGRKHIKQSDDITKAKALRDQNRGGVVFVCILAIVLTITHEFPWFTLLLFVPEFMGMIGAQKNLDGAN